MITSFGWKPTFDDGSTDPSGWKRLEGSVLCKKEHPAGAREHFIT